MSSLAAFLAVLALSGAAQIPEAAPPQIQQDPAAGGATRVDDIVVSARPLEQQVQSFVDEVAAAPRGRNLARWDRKICIGAANFDPRYAQMLVDRVSSVALGLGLESGEPGCRPDVMIVASAQPDADAQRIVRDDPYGFHPAQGGTDLGRAALQRFQDSDAPVRWWQVSMPVSADTGEVAIRLIDEDPPTISGRLASRISSNIRDDLARVLIVIDAGKMRDVSFSGLADYVALIALAQIDPEADTSNFPSVLNLFDPSRNLTGFTDWDRDYLQGLYAAKRDMALPSQQARGVVNQAVRANGARQRATEAAEGGS